MRLIIVLLYLFSVSATSEGRRADRKEKRQERVEQRKEKRQERVEQRKERREKRKAERKEKRQERVEQRKERRKERKERRKKERADRNPSSVSKTSFYADPKHEECLNNYAGYDAFYAKLHCKKMK